MNRSPALIVFNVLFATIVVVSFFMRNHYLRKLAAKKKTAAAAPSQSPANATGPAATEQAIDGLARKARLAAVSCGVGVVGAVATSIAMQAVAGP